MPADLLRSWISRLETARFARPVLAPTAQSMRRIALAGVIADTAIMSTGAAVRLSSSGLGCPDWPRCSAADIVASKNAGQTLLNTWIEFGNRLLNFPLVIITVIVFVIDLLVFVKIERSSNSHFSTKLLLHLRPVH